jgi:hypothetical protein
MKKHQVLLFALVILILFISSWVFPACTTSKTEAFVPTYGLDVNPTGSPIGGGAGYSDIYHSGDPRITTTVMTYSSLESSLSGAHPGTVIFIPGSTTITITGELHVPAGVTVASDRGYEGSTGANLIYPNPPDNDWNNGAIFQLNGRFARITGLKLTGPNTSPSSDYTTYNTYGIFSDNYYDEVDNCELSGFGGGGVVSRGPAAGKGYGETESLAYVHHNYIHDDHSFGLGYGVVVSSESSMVAEANIFDRNRLAIVSDGLPRETYEFRYNLVKAASSSNSASNPYQTDSHSGWQDSRGAYRNMKYQLIHHNQLDGMNWSFGEKGVSVQGTYICNNRLNASQDAWKPADYFSPGVANAQPVGQLYSFGNIYMQNNYVRGLMDMPADTLYTGGSNYWNNNSLVLEFGAISGAADMADLQLDPIMYWIRNYTVKPGQTLSFHVNSVSPLNTTQIYSVSGLPPNATFLPVSQSFSWTPSEAYAGWYVPLTFTSTDPGGNTSTRSTWVHVTDTRKEPGSL